MIRTQLIVGFSCALLLLMVNPTAAQPHESLEKRISGKQWKRRIILIFAENASTAELITQKKLLADANRELETRDFDQIVVLQPELSAADRAYLAGGDRKLPATANFMTYLIGKDGGIKQRYADPVSADKLFRLVDAMPMRQQEMQRKQ